MTVEFGRPVGALIDIVDIARRLKNRMDSSQLGGEMGDLLRELTNALDRLDRGAPAYCSVCNLSFETDECLEMHKFSASHIQQLNRQHPAIRPFCTG